MQINEEGTLQESEPTSCPLTEKQSHYLNTSEVRTRNFQESINFLILIEISISGRV